MRFLSRLTRKPSPEHVEAHPMRARMAVQPPLSRPGPASFGVAVYPGMEPFTVWFPDMPDAPTYINCDKWGDQ